MQPLHTLCRRIGNFVLLFGAMPDLHYINGPDTLPPPLTPQEEQQALCGLAAGEGAARDALITHNLRLVVYIAKKFESSTAGVEDMISIGTIGLIKAVNTFEPGKNIKLATYASRCIENEILMYLRSQKKRKCEVSINDPIGTDKEGNEIALIDILGTDGDTVADTVETSFEYELLLEKIQCLSERERTVLELRFGLLNSNPLTQREVGKLLGISRSYVSRIEKRAIEKLIEQSRDPSEEE